LNDCTDFDAFDRLPGKVVLISERDVEIMLMRRLRQG
jgi:hypothetical protein